MFLQGAAMARKYMGIVPLAAVVFAASVYHFGPALVEQSELERRAAWENTSILRATEAIEAYSEAHGRLPISLGELVPEYLPSELSDSWGRPYVYEITRSSHYQISTLGADGEIGGTGLGSDISSENVL